MPYNPAVINWSNEVDPQDLTELHVTSLNADRKTTQVHIDDETVIDNPYGYVFYKDLDLDTTKAYTITIVMDNLKTTHNDYSKNLNFFTFGQHLSGEQCGVFTVGTDTTNGTLKPVLGTFGKTVEDTKKATPTDTALDVANILSDAVMKFTITFNPSERGDDRLMLFVNDIKQCNGYGLGIHNFNYVVTNPRLYFLYSGWTNEIGWDNKFDYSLQRVLGVKIDRVALYPISYYESKLEDVTFEFEDFVEEFNVVSHTNLQQIRIIMNNSLAIGKKTIRIVSGEFVTELDSVSISSDNKELFTGTVPELFPSGYLSGNQIRLFIDGNQIPNETYTLPVSTKFFVDHEAPSLNVNGQPTVGVTFDKQTGQEVYLKFQYVQDNTIAHDVHIDGDQITAASIQSAVSSVSLANINPITITVLSIQAEQYKESQTIHEFVTLFLEEADPATVPTTSFLVKTDGLYELTGTSVINQIKMDDFLEVDRYYTGAYFIVANAKDKAGNTSDFIQVEVPITNNVSVVDKVSPEISIYELTETSIDHLPGVTVKGHAYDEASIFDVHALLVLKSEEDSFSMDAALKDFILSHSDVTKMLDDQPATKDGDSNNGVFDTNVKMTKYWDGTEFKNIALNESYTAFAMCIEDGGNFNYNLEKYDGFISVDQVVSAFTVGPATSSLEDTQTTTLDGKPLHVVKPGVTLDLVWTTTYEGTQDTDFDVSFGDVQLTVSKVDPTTFKATYLVEEGTIRDGEGKLIFSLQYIPKGTIITNSAEVVLLESPQVTGDFNVVSETDGSDYEHTTLTVENIVESMAITKLQNIGIYYGFPFDLEISAQPTIGEPSIHTFTSVTYDFSSTSSFEGFSRDISQYQLTGLLESTDYDVTLSIKTNNQFATSTITHNTGVDMPTLVLVTNDVDLSRTGAMSIDVIGASVSDKSGSASLYAFVVEDASDVSGLESAFAELVDGIEGIERVFDSTTTVTLDRYFTVSENGTTLVPQDALQPIHQNYKVVYFGKDEQNNSVVSTVYTPTFSTVDIDNVSMTSTNLTQSAFLKHNDLFTMRWNTKYNSKPEHFSVYIFEVPSIVNKISDTEWSVTVSVPSFVTENGPVINFMSVHYLGQSVTSVFEEAGTQLYVDVTVPVLGFDILTTRSILFHKRIQFTDVVFQDETEKNFITNDSGTYEHYEFTFNAKNKTTDAVSQVVITSPNVADYNNFNYKAIEELDIATAYSVWMEVTDPAGNRHTTDARDFTTYETNLVNANITNVAQSVSGIPDYTIEGYAYDDTDKLDVFAFVTKNDELTDVNVVQACFDITTNQRDALLLLNDSTARNQSDGAWSIAASNVYRVDGSFDSILTDTAYVLHVVSRVVKDGIISSDLNDLYVVTYALPSFSQRVMNIGFESNMANTALARGNNVVTATFETLYREVDKSRFNLEYAFADTDTPNAVELEITATNGSNTQWVANYTVDSDTPNGNMTFGLSVLADYVLDLVTTSPSVYVQRTLELNPVDITNFGTTSFVVGNDALTNALVDNLFADHTSFTYNNTFTFSMLVSSADDTDFSSNVQLIDVNKSQVPKRYTFENLKEGATYNLDFTIEDTVLGFTSHSRDNTVTLRKDAPVISSVGTTQQNVDGVLTIEARATVKDDSSTYNTYVAVFDAPLPADFDYINFYQTLGNGTHITTDSPAGAFVDISAQLTTYIDPVSYAEQQMSSAVNAYYVNYFVVDSATQPANTTVFTKTLFLNVTNYVVESSLEITNNTVPGSPYAKEGDSLTLSWETNYKSTPDTFVAQLFLVADEAPVAQLVVQGTDNTRWSITKTVPANYNGYVAATVNVNDVNFNNIDRSKNIFVDTIVPNIINLVTTSITSASIGFKELEFDDTWAHDFTGNQYLLTITCTNTRTDGVESPSITNEFVLDPNYQQKVFTVNELQSGDTYIVNATITDLVGNVSDNHYVRRPASPDEFEFKLVDEEKPVVDSVFTLSYVQNGVVLSDISVYDRHSQFDLYGVMFRVDAAYTFDEMELVAYAKTHMDADGVEFVQGISASNLDAASSNLQELHFKQAIVYDGTETPASESFVNGVIYRQCLFAADVTNGNTSACVGGSSLYNDVTYYEPHGTIDLKDTVPMETRINADTLNYEIVDQTGVVGNIYHTEILKSDIDSVTSYVMKDVTTVNENVTGDLVGSVVNFQSTSPLQGLTEWSWVTSFSVRDVTSDIDLLYADVEHNVRVTSTGQIELQWGSTSVTSTNAIGSERNDLGVVVNEASSELSVQLNGVTTTASQQIITAQATSQLYLTNSGNETLVIHNDIEFVARSITQSELTQVTTTYGKVLEYNFDTLVNDQFANELLMELPLVMSGDNAGDIVLEETYPRQGTGAVKFVTDALSMSVDLTKEDFFVNTGVSQNQMSVLVYYYHPEGVVDNHLMTFSFGNKKLALKITSSAMVITDETGANASVSFDGPLSPNRWYNLALTSESSGLTCFVDGIKVGETQTDVLLSDVKMTSIVLARGLSVGHTIAVDTRLDKFVLYNTIVAPVKLASVADNALDHGMLLRFDFELTDAGTVFDESRNHNNAVIRNATTETDTTSSVGETHMTLDGVDGYLEVAYHSDLEATQLTKSTFACWVNNDDSVDRHSIEPLVFKTGAYQFSIDYEGSADKSKGIPSLTFYDTNTGELVTHPSLVPVTAVFKDPQADRDVGYVKDDTEIGIANLDPIGPDDTVFYYVKSGIQPKPISLSTATSPIYYVDGAEFTGLNDTTASEYTLGTWFKVNN